MTSLPIKKTDTETGNLSNTTDVELSASGSFFQRFSAEPARPPYLPLRHTMKHLSNTFRLTQLFLSLIVSLGFIGSAAALECPENSPENPQLRRKLARDWFALAENAESRDNNAEAIRAYACSYKMIAHANTAYNLARVAERGGDYDLSLKMYKAYLALKPDAEEKAEVMDIIRILEVKAKDVAQGGSTPKPEEVTKDPVEPSPIVTPAPEPPKPEPTITESTSESIFSGTYKYHWLVGGVTATALVGGIVLNVSARNKMTSCRDYATNQQLETAQNECNAAKPLAYWSYAMFGITAAGAALEGFLIWSQRSRQPTDDASVYLEWLPGGGAVVARGKF
jgi:tetratricopeptide (TPR) repeat protein